MSFILLNLINCGIFKCRLVYISKHLLNRNIQIQFPVVNKIILAVTYNYSTMEKHQIFQGKGDRFSGITIDSAVENCKIENFPSILEKSLDIWKRDSKRGIWFKVNLEHSEWIPILVKSGFDFHHAKNGFVMMYKWLPSDDNNIPPYAHTMIGVGAIVVNDRSEILVVREKHGFTNMWKLPGGYVEPGENLADAAIREVHEETNIDTEFRSVLAFRHSHNAMFNCSDIYVVVNLKPNSTEIKKCEREIADSTWMSIKKYLNHPDVHELNKFVVEAYLQYKQCGIIIDCKHGIHSRLKKSYTIYFPTKHGSHL